LVHSGVVKGGLVDNWGTDRAVDVLFSSIHRSTVYAVHLINPRTCATGS